MQEGLAFTPQVAASGVAQWLWLVPAMPVLAAGVIALLKQPMRKLSSGLAIGSLRILAAGGAGCICSRAEWLVAWVCRSRGGELQLDPSGRSTGGVGMGA